MVEHDDIRHGDMTKVIDLRAVRFELGAFYRVELSSMLAVRLSCICAPVVPVAEGAYELQRHFAGFRAKRTFVSVPATSPASVTPRAPFVLVTPPGWLQSSANLELLGRRLNDRFPGVDFRLVDVAGLSHTLESLTAADVVVFADFNDTTIAPGIAFDDLCFHLHRLGVATIFWDVAPIGALGSRVQLTDDLQYRAKMRAQQARLCHFAVQENTAGQLARHFGDNQLPVPVGPLKSDDLMYLAKEITADRTPHVVIVSVLYKKADVIIDFLEHVYGQTYPGEISVILVNDRSPDADILRAKVFQELQQIAEVPPAGPRSTTIIENDENLGNCASRLKGIGTSDGDIYIVIDCDCLLNREFVAAHVFEHWDPTVDAVIGPLNIEAAKRDPAALVLELDARPAQVLEEAELQDAVQLNGFVNCITRNFSAKRRVLDGEPLFDVDFSYSAKPDSGFGWEDVNMGYRLYERSSVIRFTQEAFSVHCTHPSSVSEAAKVRGSMRNYLLLFEKKPDMALAARRWAVDTYERICAWADSVGIERNATRERLDILFAETAKRQHKLNQCYRGKRRRLKILSYRWHAPHQYEIYKLPHDFTLATHLGYSMVDTWSYDQRPLRPNVRMRPYSEINPNDFDLIILHFDENSIGSELTNGKIPLVWGEPFRQLLAVPDIPKVAICHGTPAFEGQYGLDPAQKTQFVVHEHKRAYLVNLLKDAGVKVVCNSWQAFDEWGFADSRVIWHGFDPQEFPGATYERDVLSLQSDVHRPHYRGAWEYEAVRKRLPPDIGVENARHPGSSLEIRGTNEFAVKHFRSYIDRIRSFTTYLNTTLRSPMPRSRGEAMICGVVPVCTPNHDVEHFIRNGVNGFYSNEPAELADFIVFTSRNREAARKIGLESRRTAMDLFNHDRFLADWTDLLQDAVGEQF
jgi:glycosyltransferase involved in cell wall biosynthesis